MSADVLREAAVLLREDHPSCKCGLDECPTRFYVVVALLLENEANAWESQDAQEADQGYRCVTANLARRSLLTDVARAYLAAPS